MNIQPADVMNYKLNVKNYLHKISVVNNKKNLLLNHLNSKIVIILNSFKIIHFLLLTYFHSFIDNNYFI